MKKGKVRKGLPDKEGGVRHTKGPDLEGPHRLEESSEPECNHSQAYPRDYRSQLLFYCPSCGKIRIVQSDGAVAWNRLEEQASRNEGNYLEEISGMGYTDFDADGDVDQEDPGSEENEFQSC
ncbi:MAG TPA: hypothetical protein VFF30_01065 [Nitrososphaerales archaeon]|nr:hypothetical protein [Nitrososphaerales archaeon]